jgi:hypothetical protein
LKVEGLKVEEKSFSSSLVRRPLLLLEPIRKILEKSGAHYHNLLFICVAYGKPKKASTSA